MPISGLLGHTHKRNDSPSVRHDNDLIGGEQRSIRGYTEGLGLAFLANPTARPEIMNSITLLVRSSIRTFG